ncbi:hypothetical protein [Schinkia azotoformans]|uniref:hypothetical protein n=1 Tax=Schinkia azotoformans TaxID=1454 RepID=UPI002DB7C358|nr:hypothetical protein [Schinkia azotoformans]MEC1714715.1 hypothetical protein [Schinkia azotoformans]MEC1757529.1 hypothetical protein [Schinkia azotoformans]
MGNQMQLLQLNFKNFKGVKSFSLDTQGRNAKVYADNAVGKTTLFDGFIYLLFDKDSQNKKDFGIKTLDSTGKEINGLEHAVEGVFFLDSKKLTLKKVFQEKWTKKRGAVQAEFTGHTTDYFINDVPVKKGEYEEKIKSIIQEDIFKLLTSPSYFNEQLKWQDRRKTLLEIAGDLKDDEVIASDSKLAKLTEILNGHNIDELRKMIGVRRKKINEELEKIPVRIDEIVRNNPDVTGLDKQVIEAEINGLNVGIDDKMTQINNIKNGKAITDKQIEIQKIESELLEIKRNHDSDSKDKLYQLKAKTQEEQSNISILTSTIKNIKNQTRFKDETIVDIENKLERLRKEWQEVNTQEFSHYEQCECPTCGQALPEEQVTVAREKALKQFNLEKAKKLEEINEKGKRGKEQKEALIQENKKLDLEFGKLSEQITKKKVALENLNEQLKQQESLVTDILDNPQYVSKLQEKQALEAEITQIRNESEQSIQAIQMEIVELKQKRDQLQVEVGKFALVEQSNNRIKELQEQERKLAAEFEKLEHELYLTEEFIRTKVNLLEEKINSKFKYARFKLFEVQINGGLQETCVTTYNGVPYDSGLNNAARINVGLDIINTLSEHYGFKAPIFVDNAEAVTKLIDIDTQVISLVVSEKDKQLRVEVDPVEMKEAI